MARYNREQLEQIVIESISFSEVLKKLGRKPVGGSITNISLTCKRLNISTEHMLGQAHSKGQKRLDYRIPLNELLVLGTPLDHRLGAHRLRNSMFELGIEHKCALCGITHWLGEQLVLEIDHIDERYWNNVVDNLQFLCPNCHSLKTKKHNENNKKNKEASLSQMAEDIRLDRVNVRVRVRQEVPKKFILSKHELTDLVWKLPIIHIGKQYGVSDNAIRRWIKKWEIQTPPIGYFLRKK